MNEMLIAITQQELYPFAASVIPGLIGALFGIRSGIGGARRLELNAVIDPIRDRIISSQGRFLPQYGLSAVEVDHILAMSSPWGRFRISNALKEYEKAKPECTEDAHGQTYMLNKDSVIKANTRLLAVLRRG